MEQNNSFLNTTTERNSKQENIPIGEISSNKKFIPWGTAQVNFNAISKGDSSRRDNLN